MPVTCTNYKLKCGGCPLLNQPYPDQLKHKQQLEQRLLGRFAPVSPVLGQAEPWHYRNKAIATFATGPRGRLTCGIYAAGTHRVLPYTDCLLQDTVINQTIAAVLEAARACRWPAFEEDRGTGLLRHVLVRRGKTSGQVLVVLVTAQENLPGSRNFVKALPGKGPLGDQRGAELQSPPHQRGAGQRCAYPVWPRQNYRYAVRAAIRHFAPQLLPGQPGTNRSAVRQGH